VTPADTIAAVATAPGRSGVGVVRISGPRAHEIGEVICGVALKPRAMKLAAFKDADGIELDRGIVLLFAGPRSFTGEDVVELQGHGSPVVLDQLVSRAVQLGARVARPGEFTERAFLNDKLDLAQAEAVADLINAGTATAARAAMRSLRGDFSREIDKAVERLTIVRMMIESAIDFPEEEIDFLSDGEHVAGIDSLLNDIKVLGETARQGVLISDGVRVVLAGRPNAGKSSLMNTLAGEDRAIVSHVPGTTRDLVETQIQIDGLPATLIDTAGLRESTDVIESEGVRRAHAELERADVILHVHDDTETSNDASPLPDGESPIVRVLNKCDSSERAPGVVGAGGDAVAVSALTGAGIDALLDAIKQQLGFETVNENGLVARRRHLEAIHAAAAHVVCARRCLVDDKAGELAAEELRLAQEAFGSITGAVTSDDLLGRIFSTFCIGK